MTKIIRTICLFRRRTSEADLATLDDLASRLEARGFTVQGKRLCLSPLDPAVDDMALLARGYRLGHGTFSYETYQAAKEAWLASGNRSINMDLSEAAIGEEHVELLYEMMRRKADNTFRFTYAFNVPAGCPYFPAARVGTEGFSVGLQATDLAADCASLQEWLERMKAVWREVDELLTPIPGYFGIDSSIAPLYAGDSSFVNFVRKLSGSFDASVVSPLYTTISRFIKTENPRPVGFCGLMFPCLEDFELAEEYEAGRFGIERNIFLSLHSGVGIDTYPIGIDQDPRRVLEILRLMQALSNKYNKPLTIRLVSDGKARIGEQTDYRIPVLKDVVVRAL